MTREPIDATMPFRVISQPIDTANGLARVDGDQGQAELRTLIYSILAELRPREREAIELSFRHDLHDNDLAIALGVSWSRAHALAARARARLEEALVALHIALTRRQACPVLGELLADWDGRLTEETRDLVGWHIEQCQACANHGRGALRPAAFSRLLPLAPLPPELREQVLSRCSSTAEDAVAYRRRVARRAESTWFASFSQPISWKLGQHPGQSRSGDRRHGRRAVGRGGGERHAAHLRGLPRRACPGGSAKRQDLLEQSRGATAAPPRPRTAAATTGRREPSHRQAVPDLRAARVCASLPRPTVAVAVALAQAVEVTQAVDRPSPRPRTQDLRRPLRLTVTVSVETP